MEFATDVTLGLKNPLNPPLMNGAGCIKTTEDVREASQSPVGAIVTGSFTVEPRDGNPGETFWPGRESFLNSLGLPNRGIPYLEENLPEMVEICHDAGKQLVVSVAGFSTDEYVELTRLCKRLRADGVELNLGCPNIVQKDGSRKTIPSYNEELFGRIINNVTYMSGFSPLWAKVSPIFDGEQIKRFADILVRHSSVKAVTVMNTVPNCYSVDDNGKSRITVGLAGMSGPAIKPIGLGQVLQWRNALPDNISVIGVGGIVYGEDLRDYFNVGASACQVTSEVLRQGKLNMRIFDRLIGAYDHLEFKAVTHG